MAGQMFLYIQEEGNEWFHHWWDNTRKLFMVFNRKVCFPSPQEKKKKSDTSCTLYQFSNKVKNQEKLGLAGFWAGIEEHWTVKPQSVFPDRVVLSSVVKGWCWWRRDTQWLSETVKENWGRKTDEIDVQWVPTHLKSSYWWFRLQTE